MCIAAAYSIWPGGAANVDSCWLELLWTKWLKEIFPFDQLFHVKYLYNPNWPSWMCQKLENSWMGACAGYLCVAWRHIRRFVECYPWHYWRRSSVVRAHRDCGSWGYIQSAGQRNHRLLHFEWGPGCLRIYSRVLVVRGILQVQRLLPRDPEYRGRLLKYSLSVGISTAFKLRFIIQSRICDRYELIFCFFYILRASAGVWSPCSHILTVNSDPRSSF